MPPNANPFAQFGPQQQPQAAANPFAQFGPQSGAAQGDVGRDELGGTLLPPPAPTPTRPSLLTRLNQYGHNISQGVTFGFGDDIAAGLAAATQPVLGGGSDAPTFAERYQANKATERQDEANTPAIIAIPGQIAGGAAMIATGAPAAAAKIIGAGARLIPGANALFEAGSTAAQTTRNALSALPGASYVAPAAKFVAPAVAEGAAYGAVQGAGDTDGGLAERAQGAVRGAETGAVLGPVVATGARVVGKGIQAVRRALSEAGVGTKAPLLDADGNPILDSKGQTISATPGVQNVAAAQIDAATSDPVAVRAKLAEPRNDLPGWQPTFFQSVQDQGLGEKELALRNAPGSSQDFLAHAARQNAALTEAVDTIAPADASSANLATGLKRQDANLATASDAAGAKAAEGTLQGVGGVADSTPTQAGVALRNAVDQARRPAISRADAAVQQGTEDAAGARDRMGGALPPGADASTAAQRFGQQFRAVMDASGQASKDQASALYHAVDPDGTLVVSMTPARTAGRDIVNSMSVNDEPLSGKEAAIFDTVRNLPDAQSYRDLGALSSRVTTAMRAARADPEQAQTYARLSRLRGALADILTDTATGRAAEDEAAVRAGQMAPEDAMAAKLQGEFNAYRDSQQAAGTATGRATGTAGGAIGAAGPTPVRGAGGGTGAAGRRSGPVAGSSGVQEPPLVPNATEETVQRIADANAFYGEHKATFGSRAPGVGAVLAPGPTAGTFKMAESAVPSAIWSKGAGTAERIQAATRAGLSPAQIANYAAYDLRRVAQREDGTLDPAAFTRWRHQNNEGVQALTRLDPSLGARFDTAEQAARRLDNLRAQRAALDEAHPINPGWGDAEVLPRVWQAGPKGADTVRAATSGANGSPLAANSIADYAAYTLRKMAAPNGVLVPSKYATWTKTYDGALSARPDIRAEFDTAAKAQAALDTSAAEHKKALADFRAGAAGHYLDDGDPARRTMQILRSATADRDMASLAKLTADDQVARDGLKAAVRDGIYDQLLSNARAVATGRKSLKSDVTQTFIRRASGPLEHVMTPAEVRTLRDVAEALETMNTSVEGVKTKGGSDTTQKAQLAAQGTKATMLGWLRDNALQSGLTIAGFLKGGPVGAFLGNKASSLVATLRAKGIAQIDDLVKEVMLNPALARVLLANVDAQTGRNVANGLVAQAARIAAPIAASRGAHVAAILSAPQNALAQ